MEEWKQIQLEIKVINDLVFISSFVVTVIYIYIVARLF